MIVAHTIHAVAAGMVESREREDAIAIAAHAVPRAKPSMPDRHVQAQGRI